MSVDILFASSNKELFFIGRKLIALNTIYSFISFKECLYFAERRKVVKVNFLNVFVTVIFERCILWSFLQCLQVVHTFGVKSVLRPDIL